MKKVLAFLEQNVHWVAVALGALYLLFMAYTYVFQAPVSVEVNGQKLGPGDIDKHIHDHPVAALSNQMNRGGQPPEIPAPQWLKEFKEAMDFSTQKPAELASKPWIHSTPIPGMSMQEKGPEQQGPDIQPVADLPAVPPAIMGGAIAMASTVAPAGQGASGTGVDKNIAVVAFTLSNKQLTDAFKAIKLPQVLYSTCELEVNLYRQQQKSDGSWDQPALIKRLPFDAIQLAPKESATVDQKRAFLNWAKDNQKPILQPTFYDVINGDKLVIPPALPQAPVEVAPPPAAAEGLPNFDPTRWEYTAEEWKQMTPEQRKQAQDAKKKHDEEERNKRKGQRGGSRGGGKGGKGGGASGGCIDDPDRPDDPIPTIVPNPYSPAVTASLLMLQQPQQRDQDEEERRQREQQQQQQAQQGKPADPGAPAPAPAAGQHPCPNGFFDPSTSPDWVGWAFDDTVEPGKTYRYSVQYSVKNPLFDKPRNSAKPDMAKVLVLVSDLNKTEWGMALKIPARTSFYVAGSVLEKATTVQFDVFAWQGGAKRQKRFTVGPGDMIGGKDGEVDFTTGSTVVDIVPDARTGHAFVLVADPSGALSRRDFTSDQANPELQNDKRAVAMGTAPAPSPVAEGR